MSAIIGSPLLLGGDATTPSYTTQRSVRLRSSASAYFGRTPAGSTNQLKFTFSAWVKRGALADGNIFGAYTGSGIVDTNFFSLAFVGNKLQCNGWSTVYFITNDTYRDPSAWMHIVVAVDVTQAIAANRILLWVNGKQITTFASSAAPAQNVTLVVNGAAPHYLGWCLSGYGYLDGYMTEINHIDGQTLTASSFGEFDSVRNTQWKPKAYTGTYGTNGFYLKFADNSAATAAALGKDSSGNGNNWTPNGISLTAGATYDSMTDVPTLTSETASNFCVLNPVSTNVSGIVPQQGNLYLGSSATYNYSIVGTIGVSSGKWYWECRTDSGFSMVGITSLSSLPLQIAPHQSGSLAKIIYAAAAQKYDNGTSSAYGATWTSADLIGIALDMDAGTLTFYKNGTSLGVAFSGLTGIYYPVFGGPNSYNHGWINFGQRPFEQTVPTNFQRLNTYNLPEPAVASSDDYHQVYTYTGNGGGLQVGEIQKPLSLYNLDRSLRFRASASAYLSRTFGTPTNQDKWTYSTWVKRGALGAMPLFGQGTVAGNGFNCTFQSDDSLEIYYPNTGATADLKTTRLFKDPANFYHVVIAYDLAQATPSNRLKVYVNGVQETVFSLSTYPSASVNFNTNGGAARIGNNPIFGGFFDGYLADVYFIDGQALDPTSFGQYDGNYYWTPKAYSGAYGTNGFHLEFKDYSASTAAAIGKDTSGRGNDWTPNSVNLTTPANTNASWDSMVDVPTLTSADVANFCTLNPLRSFVSGSTATFTDGNLSVSIPAVTNPPRNVTSTYDVFSGKWYWEVIAGTVASNFVTGIASKAMDFNATLFTTGSYVYDATTGNKNIGGTATAYGASYTTGDTIGIALDLDAGTLTFYKNGVSQGVAVTGLQGLTVTPVIAASGSSAITGTFNFGQRPFKYSNYGTDRPAATFKPINSFNIAEVTGDLESPDFVWIKSRSAGTEHALFNSVVGAGKYLRSSNTAIEVVDVNSLIQFNKNGFLLGNAAIVNASAATFVASAWKVAANNQNITVGQYATTPANVPSIASTVRANPTAGISVVTYTGNQTAGATVGHGLGVAPSLIIAKTKAAVTSWAVYHKSLGATSWLMLNSTLLRTVSAQEWNNTEPTPTVFTVGNSSSNSNQAATTVAYCFAEISGFSKFISYAANASSTDGPYIVCGFAPRWIMIKRATGASGSGGWIMYDTARSSYNVMSEYLFAEGAAGASTLAAIDVTANGFKIRSNNVHLNQTAGDIYIVMAFAEHPFKYALAR